MELAQPIIITQKHKSELANKQTHTKQKKQNFVWGIKNTPQTTTKGLPQTQSSQTKKKSENKKVCTKFDAEIHSYTRNGDLDKAFEWLITLGWKSMKKMKRKNSETHTRRGEDRNEKESVMETEMNRKSKKEGEKSIIQQPFIIDPPHTLTLSFYSFRERKQKP